MSQCSPPNLKNKNTRVITQIGKKEYLLEGTSDWVKFGCQFDVNFITSANLDGGPFLLVGDNFLGKGVIRSIQHIDSNQDNYIILKILLY